MVLGFAMSSYLCSSPIRFSVVSVMSSMSCRYLIKCVPAYHLYSGDATETLAW